MSLTFFTQRYVVADFLQAKYDFNPKTAVLRFKPPPPGGKGGLGATYDDHLRLIRKRIVDFLSLMLVLGLGLKESLRTIFVSLALALALKLKSLALALTLNVKSSALALALKLKSLALALALALAL